MALSLFPSRFIRPPRLSAAGFTLIELSIVLVILALIATFVMPRLGDALRANTKKEARLLAGTIKYAFNDAVTTKRVMAVVYDIEANSYSIQSFSPALFQKPAEAGDGTPSASPPPPPPRPEGEESMQSSLINSRTFPPGINFQDVMSAASFYEPVTSGTTFTLFRPDGFAEPTWIHLVDDNEQHISIEILPLTGNVQIYMYYAAPGIEEPEP
jgi:prepilin-type N-terminal cleavage/methylation domain-containing protein